MTGRADGLTPLTAEPRRPSRPWLAVFQRHWWLPFLIVLVQIVNAFRPWRALYAGIAMACPLVLLGLFLWGLMASVHDWWAVRRFRQGHCRP
jgi:hypothetical protein